MDAMPLIMSSIFSKFTETLNLNFGLLLFLMAAINLFQAYYAHQQKACVTNWMKEVAFLRAGKMLSSCVVILEPCSCFQKTFMDLDLSAKAACLFTF